MGLFNSYLKEGKGVDKNAPKKRGIFLFVDILVQKFSKFLGANTLLTLTSLLWIAALYFFAAIALANTGIADKIAASIASADNTINIDEAKNSILVMLQIMVAMGIFTLWGSGPSSAAYAYINRCFTRGEPVWVVSDGKDKFVENFKQSMIVVVIDAAVLLFGVNAMLFYHASYAATHSFIWMLLTYIMILVFVIYTMMHPFIYQIMVTFECSIVTIYKNALLITLARLPGAVFTTAVSTGVILALFLIMNPVVAALFLGVFGLCVTRYVTDFYAARVIEKSMIRNIKAKQSKPVIEYIEEDDEE